MFRRPGLRNLGGGFAGRVLEGPGENILWIHGYTLDSTSWLPLWSRLADFSHLGIDLPGHGASMPIAKDASLPSVARQLSEIANEHRARHVVALSFGTILALQLVLDFPLQFESLVLGAPALGGGPRDPEVEVCYDELRMIYQLTGFSPKLCQRWMKSPPRIFPSPDRNSELWRDLYSVVSAHSWWELGDDTFFSLSWHSQTEQALKAIKASVMVLVGEDEMPAFKRSGEIIRRSVPKCRRLYLNGTGHLCLLEDPAFAATQIRHHILANPTLLQNGNSL